MSSPFQSCLGAAKWYLDHGYSVIPVSSSKTALIKWREFQGRRASVEEVEEWWRRWPTAQVGVVTGRISNLLVIDCDTQQAVEAMTDAIGDSYITPIVVTPRGRHYWFAYKDGLRNMAHFIGGADCRGEGGMVVAPPSVNTGGVQYYWQITPLRCKPAELPESILRLLSGGGDEDVSREPARKLAYVQGQRDNDLYHTALSLLRGGMSEENVLTTLQALARACDPPFPEEEVAKKLESAKARLATSSESHYAEVARMVREWVSSVTGVFSSTQLYQDLGITMPADKEAVRQLLHRMVQRGLIVRDSVSAGRYRRPDREVYRIDLRGGAASRPCNITMPLGEHRLAEIYPGNIILLAGETNAGKTAWALSLARANMDKFDVHYFSSEMGEEEFLKRLSMFQDITPADWNMQVYERSQGFADVIVPGEAADKPVLNIIDFLEVHDQFWRISAELAAIHDALKGAVCVVCIQKSLGERATGVGGSFSLHKPRLALALRRNEIEIVKAKNWVDPRVNPNGLIRSFVLENGVRFRPTTEWRPKQEVEYEEIYDRCNGGRPAEPGRRGDGRRERGGVV